MTAKVVLQPHVRRAALKEEGFNWAGVKSRSVLRIPEQDRALLADLVVCAYIQEEGDS